MISAKLKCQKNPNYFSYLTPPYSFKIWVSYLKALKKVEKIRKKNGVEWRDSNIAIKYLTIIMLQT